MSEEEKKALWKFGWKTKIQDFRRLSCGTCVAYSKQVNELVDKMEVLIDKIAGTIDLKFGYEEEHEFTADDAHHALTGE